MTEGHHPRRALGAAAFLVFALSGCSGLIYQSIWSQYLGLYLGHAAYAQSLVLAIFMGGMAVGAWWASRRSLKWRNLLLAYAVIEFVIGLAAVAFHPVFLGTLDFAYDTAFPAMPGGWAVQLFKWTSGTLLILPQAILLGMTFPLMSNGLMRRLSLGNGAILGGLYFTNSIGAAFGALFATFVLLPAVGLPGAMRFGAILNIVVALIAYVLAREPESPLQTPAPAAGSGSPLALGRLLMAAAFITGATSFIYEIGWIRMLSLAFGATVHAFELMLTAFIGGLAFGGLWIRKRIDGYAQPIRVGGWVQLLMGLAALASLIVYDRSFEWVAWFLAALSRSPSGYDLYNFVTIGVSMLIMAPAAFFAGMTLPLFTLSLIRAGGGEASVGRIYSANTIGAIVGVFAAVHLLIPLLGLKLAMIIAAAGDVVLGFVLLRRDPPLNPAGQQEAPDRGYLAALALGGAALAITLFAARFDPNAMASGVYRHGVARLSPANREVLYYRDGKTASIAAVHAIEGVTSISTNGKVDAGIRMTPDGRPSADEITMVMAAALPLLYHPDPRNAAVIGFGSGLSTHAMLGDQRLQRVDTIEIEPAMIEGARVFGDYVGNAYKDPRSHIHIEDAKTYFAANQLKYDIILSEPSNPWVSGVASLFSREFYRFVPRHLKPGGLFMQWVQIYEINDELVGTVVRGLSESFSDYRVYLANSTDMLILARVDGQIGEMNEAVLESAGLKPLLSRVGVPTRQDIVSHQLGDRASLGALFESMSHRTNSDFYPILSLEAPRMRFVDGRANAIHEFQAADLPYREVIGGLPPPRETEITPNPYYRYSTLIQAANRIADSLRSGQVGGSVEMANDAARIAYLREAVGQCRLDGPSAAAQDALVSLAAATVPYLDVETRSAIWVKPAWVSCDRQPEELRALLRVITAMAQADWAGVQREATAALSGDQSMLSPRTRDWLLRSAMLGAIGAKDTAAVVTLDESVGKDVPVFPATVTYLKYLRRYGEQHTKAAP